MSRSSERGLGRGLAALIPRATAGLRDLPIDTIRPNPQQPRESFDETALDELAQSIREFGVLQPILVSQQADGSYQLITGERRWRATRLAGLPTIPAVIKEATPQASLAIALVENIQRRDLNPLEEAHAFRQLIDEHGLTQEQISQRIGKSRVAVSNTLRLLQLPAPVLQALAVGSITEGHARAILTASGEPLRLETLRRVLAGQLSVRETEALARSITDPPPAAAEPLDGRPPADDDDDNDLELEQLEDAFRQALGTRVKLYRGRNGGRLVIHFYSDDELQGLYETIVRT